MTRSVSGRIRPLASAIGMNSVGGTRPRVGCCQRSSASTRSSGSSTARSWAEDEAQFVVRQCRARSSERLLIAHSGCRRSARRTYARALLQGFDRERLAQRLDDVEARSRPSRAAAARTRRSWPVMIRIGAWQPRREKPDQLDTVAAGHLQIEPEQIGDQLQIALAKRPAESPPAHPGRTPGDTLDRAGDIGVVVDEQELPPQPDPPGRSPAAAAE